MLQGLWHRDRGEKTCSTPWPVDVRTCLHYHQVKRQNLEKRKSRDFVKLRTAKKNSRLTTEISSFQTEAKDGKSRDTTPTTIVYSGPGGSVREFILNTTEIINHTPAHLNSISAYDWYVNECQYMAYMDRRVGRAEYFSFAGIGNTGTYPLWPLAALFLELRIGPYR